MDKPERLPEFIAAGVDPHQTHYPVIFGREGDLVCLPKTDGLNETQRKVEAEFNAWLSEDWGRAIQTYWRRAARILGSKNIKDSDVACGVYGDFIDTKQKLVANIPAIRASAAWLSLDDYWNAIKAPTQPGKDTVCVLIGAGSSGKTTAAKSLMRIKGNPFAVMFPRVLSSVPNVTQQIGKVLYESDKKIDLRLVLRDPEGLIHARIHEALATGRTEPLDQFALRYVNCILAFEAVHRYFPWQPNSRVRFGVMTNFGEAKDIALSGQRPLDLLNNIRKEIPGAGQRTTDTINDARRMREGMVRLAYALAEESRDELKGELGTAMMGDRDRGLRQAAVPDVPYDLNNLRRQVERDAKMPLFAPR